MSAAERAERIMSIVPWLVTPGGVSISETCATFQIEREELLEDLRLLFVNVGVHPFTPDARVDVFIEEEDDTVEVLLGDFFRRPLRLDADEALTIVAAARVLIASGHEDPHLLAAVEKVERVLGSGDRLVAVELGAIDPGVLAEVRRALEDGLQLRIRYHSFGRDQVGERTVEPHSLRSRDGRWYLTAWCTSAEEERVFRLDRVLAAETLDEPVVSDPPAQDALFDFAASGRSIRMVLGPSDRWVATQYPTESERTLDDGRVEVVLSVGSTAWLERLLLRMDPDTVVEDATTGLPLDDVRRAAAQRIIDRHG